MSGEAANGSPESDVSGLDFEETELKLAPPGGGSRGIAGAAAAESERKRGFAETVNLTLGGSSGAPRAGARADPSADSAESKASANVKPPAKAQVVGWPPVRSFRKNALKSCTYVKVAVDGAPYLRKVDLELYSGYQQLLSALEEMFSCFTIRNYPDEVRLVDTVNGTEYVPTYEDKDGDWMLVGDVPWKMFIESCKRLRLMKSTEAVNLVLDLRSRLPPLLAHSCAPSLCLCRPQPASSRPLPTDVRGFHPLPPASLACARLLRLPATPAGDARVPPALRPLRPPAAAL